MRSEVFGGREETRSGGKEEGREWGDGLGWERGRGGCSGALSPTELSSEGGSEPGDVEGCRGEEGEGRDEGGNGNMGSVHTTVRCAVGCDWRKGRETQFLLFEE